MFGISFRDHTQRNCLMNLYVHRCCHAARLIQVQGPFYSWIMLEFIILRYLEPLRCPLHQLMVQELEQICLDAKIKLEYLPLYSPDYNPIEEAFAELKAWMKKNYLLGDGYETFQGFV